MIDHGLFSPYTRTSMATPQIDPQIIAAAQAGDMRAFERIVATFEQAIFRHVSRFVSHRPDAEDITQEIFFKLYKHLDNIDLQKTFSPWLYTIATHTVYDFLRKKKRSRELLILDNEATPETIDPNDTYYQIEAKVDINTALSRIKPAYRAILLLFYADGLSYEELGTALSLPRNTVKIHLHRAKKALKDHLEQEE